MPSPSIPCLPVSRFCSNSTAPTTSSSAADSSATTLSSRRVLLGEHSGRRTGQKLKLRCGSESRSIGESSRVPLLTTMSAAPSCKVPFSSSGMNGFSSRTGLPKSCRGRDTQLTKRRVAGFGRRLASGSKHSLSMSQNLNLPSAALVSVSRRQSSQDSGRVHSGAS